MKRSLAVLLCLFIFTMNLYTDCGEAHALDPKVKAFALVSGYGAAGGALLGLASMAFGEEAIAIARGASLGLYAGMLFGGYVILSHHYKKKYPDNEYYHDPATPYQPQQMQSPYGGGSGYDGDFFAPPEDAPQRIMQIEYDREAQRRFNPIKQFNRPGDVPVYMDLVRFTF